MTTVLTLNVKCSGNNGRCTCGKTPDNPDIIARKETDPQSVRGFVAYIHESNEPFTLKKDLYGNDKLDIGPIYEAEKVSVYYWDGDHDSIDAKPLLIEVIKKSHSQKYHYYIKYESDEQEVQSKDANTWVHDGHPPRTPLQDRLDDRNLAIHNVVPFDIDNPAKDRNFSPGRSESKGIKLVPGSQKTFIGTNYTSKEYTVKGGDTKISRVTFNGTVTNGINLKNQKIYTVRLFYPPSNHNQPLLIEVLKDDDKYDYYSGKDGINWTIVTDGSETLLSGVKQLPDEDLEKELENLNCQYYKLITMDLSHIRSNNYAISESKYCCKNHERKDEGKVSVKRKAVSCEHNNSNSIPYYKHSIEDGEHKLTSIIFYQSGQRDRKKIGGQDFPISSVESVSAFYDSGNNPVLVYFEGGGNEVNKKWFKNSGNYDKPWTKVENLQNINPETINDCNDGNFKELVKALKEVGCNYEECKKTTPEVPKEPKPEPPPEPAVPPEPPKPPARSVGAGILAGYGLYSIISGVFGGSGAVGLAGYHLYKHTRDPWVRQI